MEENVLIIPKNKFIDFIEMIRKDFLENDPFILNMQNELDFYKEEKYKNLYDEYLKEIKTSYPDEKAENIFEFGNDYIEMLKSNINPLIAYEAIRAIKNKAGFQPTMGEITPSSNGKEAYFTRAQVEKMTPKEVKKYYHIIENSMKNW